MLIQSKTYNGGKVIEYIYNIIPESGSAYKNSVFIDATTGLVIPMPKNLKFDGVTNSFQGTCCAATLPEECEGWITDDNECWITDGGLSWGL